MALWNKNDSEAGKPTWLTEEQKRQCVRTVRGWEIPLAGSGFTNTQETIFGATANGSTSNSYLFRAANFVGPMELLVAMPINPSTTGTTSSDFAGFNQSVARGGSGGFWGNNYGATNGSDTPNYPPYFTSPVQGVTFGVSRGTTAYIPFIAAEANFTDLLRNTVFSVTGPTVTGLSYSLQLSVTAGTFPDAKWLNQPTQLVGRAATGFYDPTFQANVAYNQFGGWGGVTQGTAAFIIGTTAGGPTGTFTFTGSAVNSRAGGGAGQTGTSNFQVIIS